MFIILDRIIFSFLNVTCQRDMSRVMLPHVSRGNKARVIRKSYNSESYNSEHAREPRGP